MLETDTSSLIGRAASAARKRAFSFGNTGATDTRPVLMWLAGAGYRPREIARNKGMVPLSKGAEDAADRLLTTAKPTDPILAARMRADILVGLRREATDDPRTEAVFDADPVLAADPETGWLVTQSMLDARIGLFDSLNTLLDKPYLNEAACADMRHTLVDAFAYLSPDSQREWNYSEVRLEQGLAFLESRGPSELLALADELRPVNESRGLWDTLRLFSLAAQMSDVSGADTAPVTNLLAMREAG